MTDDGSLRLGSGLSGQITCATSAKSSKPPGRLLMRPLLSGGTLADGEKMGLGVRVFKPEDHASAWALWKSTDGVGLSNASSFESVSRFLERNPGLSFVATDDDLIVGTILCGHDGRRGFIHSLAVSTAHRRKGLGRTLVTRALAALRLNGIEKCHLLVFNENSDGRAFWKAIGAEERITLGLFSLVT